MTTKKPSLSAVLHEASGRRTPPPEPASPVAEIASHTPRTRRETTKLIGGHFDPLVSRQLKQIALDENSTVQALLTEALNDLFAKYGKKPIA